MVPQPNPSADRDIPTQRDVHFAEEEGPAEEMLQFNHGQADEANHIQGLRPVDDQGQGDKGKQLRGMTPGDDQGQGGDGRHLEVPNDATTAVERHTTSEDSDERGIRIGMANLMPLAEDLVYDGDGKKLFIKTPCICIQ